MSTSEKAVKIRDTIVAQVNKITKIHGDITPSQIDALEEEIGSILTGIKSNHFKEGQKYGHLAVILREATYRTVIGDATRAYVEPADHGAYNITAATNTNTGQRAQQEKVHERKNDDYQVFLGVEEGARELIVHAVGEDVVIALKERYIKYSGKSPQEMMKYLRDKACVKLTELEKEIMKSDGLKQPWDTTKNIVGYFKRLNDFEIECDEQ